MVLVEEIHCLRRRLPRIKKAEVEEWDEPRAAWKNGGQFVSAVVGGDVDRPMILWEIWFLCAIYSQRSKNSINLVVECSRECPGSCFVTWPVPLGQSGYALRKSSTK